MPLPDSLVTAVRIHRPIEQLPPRIAGLADPRGDERRDPGLSVGKLAVLQQPTNLRRMPEILAS